MKISRHIKIVTVDGIYLPDGALGGVVKAPAWPSPARASAAGTAAPSAAPPSAAAAPPSFAWPSARPVPNRVTGSHPRLSFHPARRA
jgi:hypothetical protein